MSIVAQRRWILSADPPASLLDQTPEHPLLVRTLYRRGYTTPSAIDAFLRPGVAMAHRPLPEIDRAVARIGRAIAQGEIICVYGDFDADGVTATALMVIALQAAGGKVGAYIPERVDEGYGLNKDAIRRIAEKQANLIVTVDCGMRSLAEVAHANALGVDVIVTDHHSVGTEVLPAVAVVNPRLEGSEVHTALAGVGVAYRLAQAVLHDAAAHRRNGLTPERVEEIEDELLDLVALGTVADMMPLVNENRTLVQRGLQRMRACPRPGIAALMEVASVTRETLDAQAISFRLAPRINAAGRLANAMIAYRLLRTKDLAEARLLAQQLEALNRNRQSLTTEAEAEAEAQVAEQQQAAQGAGAEGKAPWLYIVESSKIRSGIVGLVAGKLAEKYYRPAVVLETGAEESRGSARSIREFDIGAALDEVSDMLVRHGGHSRAAGFTVRNQTLPALRKALAEIAASQLATHERLQPTLEIDAEAELPEVTWGLLEQFARLEPTGQENPQPLLLTRRTRLRSYRSVGGEKHLKVVLDGGGWGDAVQDAIAFNMGALASHLRDGDLLDIVYAVERNDFANRRTLQLNIKDIAHSVG